MEGDIATTLLTSTGEDGNPIGTEYKLTPVVDQSSMFNAVVQRLAKGMAVGIYQY